MSHGSAPRPVPVLDVTHFAGELAEVMRRVALDPQDSAAAEALDRAETLAVTVALTPPKTLGELALKLDILCARLRLTVDPGLSGEVVSYMLAESARDDLRALMP